MIVFNRVPIITPSGEKLVGEIDLTIKHGENVLVTGPNGCGKSSMFRILGGLWPVFRGSLSSPALNDLFYIPQKAYLPKGTLRDQIIYPDTRLQMLKKKVSDSVSSNRQAAFDDVLIRWLAGLVGVATSSELGVHRYA